jgi:hypothetical protein
VEDKLRLFAVFFLSTENEISKDDMREYEEALTAIGADLAPLQYIKKCAGTKL